MLSLRMHERLDWKVYNFVLALLPAAALYATMTYVRKDMDRLVSEGGLEMVCNVLHMKKKKKKRAIETDSHSVVVNTYLRLE